MRRTSVSLAAAVLAAGVAVSACGTIQLGAAAITAAQRTSSATLTGQVANLAAAYQAADMIEFEGKQLRRDIAGKSLAYLAGNR